MEIVVVKTQQMHPCSYDLTSSYVSFFTHYDMTLCEYDTSKRHRISAKAII